MWWQILWRLSQYVSLCQKHLGTAAHSRYFEAFGSKKLIGVEFKWSTSNGIFSRGQTQMWMWSCQTVLYQESCRPHLPASEIAHALGRWWWLEHTWNNLNLENFVPRKSLLRAANQSKLLPMNSSHLVALLRGNFRPVGWAQFRPCAVSLRSWGQGLDGHNITKASR